MPRAKKNFDVRTPLDRTVMQSFTATVARNTATTLKMDELMRDYGPTIRDAFASGETVATLVDIYLQHAKQLGRVIGEDRQALVSEAFRQLRAELGNSNGAVKKRSKVKTDGAIPGADSQPASAQPPVTASLPMSAPAGPSLPIATRPIAGATTAPEMRQPLPSLNTGAPLTGHPSAPQRSPQPAPGGGAGAGSNSIPPMPER